MKRLHRSPRARSTLSPARALGALLTAAALWHGPARAEDPRLAEAEALARRSEPAAAADLYRSLIRDGVDGPGVRYNLGTLALREGRVGEAVLHLRTAQRMAPRDDDVQHNLTVALDARVDRLAGDPVVAPFAALGHIVPALAARLALAIPLALLGVTWALIAVVRGRALRVVRLAAVGLALCIASGGTLYAARRTRELTREAVVLVEKTSARREPSMTAPEAFVAHAGLLGDVVDEVDGFVRVRFENGLEAWLAGDDVGLIAGAAPAPAVTSAQP